jgi:tRNA pseudouridine55 synthase
MRRLRSSRENCGVFPVRSRLGKPDCYSGYVDGVIVVDKPGGWTSHDVVGKMRRLAGMRKVGHLGTLDPSATGVLPLVLGRATRLAQFFTRDDKVYEGTFHFGYSTDTYDAEGERTSRETPVALDRDELDRVLEQFRGEILQTPPPVSAKKIAGRPAYELARKRQAVDLAPVRVTVHELKILAVEGCQARVRIHCTAGTYVRAIAHDAGKAMGCGAFLRDLRRLSSGDFSIEQARTIEELTTLAAENLLDRALIPAQDLLPDFPSELVDLVTAGQIRNGRDFRISPFHGAGGARYVKAITAHGELIAIGEARLPLVYHPVLVL